MSNYPRPGDASTDEAEITQAAQAEAIRVDKLRTYETDHLCIKCMHEPICQVVGAIKQVGGEGDIVIAQCNAFRPESPTLADLIAQAEDVPDSDEDPIKDRR